MIWRHFRAWLSLTNTPKVPESKYQAGFGVIISGQNPQTFIVLPYYMIYTIMSDSLKAGIKTDVTFDIVSNRVLFFFLGMAPDKTAGIMGGSSVCTVLSWFPASIMHTHYHKWELVYLDLRYINLYDTDQVQHCTHAGVSIC